MKILTTIVIALLCVTAGLVLNTTGKQPASQTLLTKEENARLVVEAMSNGSMSSDEAIIFLGLNEGRFFETTHQMFFPWTWNPVISVIGEPASQINCADPEPPWNDDVGCLWSENPNLKCKIVVRVSGAPNPDSNGNYLYIKECDGLPIATSGPTGVVIDYDTVTKF